MTVELLHFVEGSLIAELVIVISPLQPPLYPLAIPVLSFEGVVFALLQPLPVEDVVLEPSLVAAGGGLEVPLGAVCAVVGELPEEEGSVGEDEGSPALRPSLHELPHEAGTVALLHPPPSLRPHALLNSSRLTPSNSPSYTSCW
jgi:hypothetical protein